MRRLLVSCPATLPQRDQPEMGARACGGRGLRVVREPQRVRGAVKPRRPRERLGNESASAERRRAAFLHYLQAKRFCLVALFGSEKPATPRKPGVQESCGGASDRQLQVQRAGKSGSIPSPLCLSGLRRGPRYSSANVIHYDYRSVNRVVCKDTELLVGSEGK